MVHNHGFVTYGQLQRRPTMPQVVETVLRTVYGYLYRRSINAALALHRRGEARPDGLRATKICNRLEIDWHARRIHPWDSDDPQDVKRESFVRQSLADTDAAIRRLFQMLPHVNTIKLRVLDPESEAELIAGTVCRADASQPCHEISAGMRLRAYGIRFRSTGYTLEQLDTCTTPPFEKGGRGSPGLVPIYRRTTEK